MDRGDARLEVEVARVLRLGLDRDGVAVGRRVAGVEAPAGAAAGFDQAADEVLGTAEPVALDDFGEAVEPVEGLGGVAVGAEVQVRRRRIVSHGAVPLV